VNSTLTGPVATYLAQVRAELSDLPAGELDDVLDDVSGHLTEVAAEFEDEPTAASLQERLGTPRQYADELRTAAGYPPRKVTGTEKTGAEAALRWGIVASIVGPFFVVIGLANGTEETLFFGVIGLIALFGAAYLGVRALRGNNPEAVLATRRGKQAAESISSTIDQIPPNVQHELVTIGQPVWWVARGIVGGGAIFAVSGAAAVTVVGALAGAVVSVWIGRKTQQDRRWLWYVVPLNVIAAIIVPIWLAFSFVGGTSSRVFGDDYTPSSGYNQSGLWLDGNGIENIYPFDERGQQVKVRLYDQSGNPINLQEQNCRLDSADYSDTLSNTFPHRRITEGSYGSSVDEGCKDSEKAPFVPPPAPATTPATTSVTPSPTPGASLTPGKTPTPAPPAASKPGVTLTMTPAR